MEKKITLQELRKYAALDLEKAEGILKTMINTLLEEGAMKLGKEWSEEFYYRGLVAGFYRFIVEALSEDEEGSLQSLLKLQKKLEMEWRAGFEDSTTSMERLNKEKEGEAAVEALAKVNNLIFYLKK